MPNLSGPPTSPSDDSDWDALARYLSGESDPAEARAVETWLASRPEEAELAAAVQQRAAAAQARADVVVNVDQALARVRSQIGVSRTPVHTPLLTVSNGGAAQRAVARTTVRRARADASTATPRPFFRFWPVAVLASAAMLAVVVVRSIDTKNSPTERQFATKVGASDSVRLADGSLVILAPGSKLTVAAGFGGAARSVTLDGAAFFDVQHDATRPFTVRAGGAEIRDIGTAFSVKTDAAGAVVVAVTHGRVAIRRTAAGPSATPIELQAGDRGTLDGERLAVARGSVTEDDVSWTHGVLAYRDAPMSEVQADLRRWYGIDLRLVGTELSHRTLKASFRADSSADAVHVIALALGANASWRGDTVFLEMAGRSTTP